MLNHHACCSSVAGMSFSLFCQLCSIREGCRTRHDPTHPGWHDWYDCVWVHAGAREAISSLAPAEEEAREARRGLFTYGDPGARAAQAACIGFGVRSAWSRGGADGVVLWTCLVQRNVGAAEGLRCGSAVLCCVIHALSMSLCIRSSHVRSDHVLASYGTYTVCCSRVPAGDSEDEEAAAPKAGAWGKPR